MNLPKIVSAEEWQAARDELLVEEKAATRLLDALAAKRRRLPMVEFRTDYVFDGPEGERSLLDLFDGRRQLVVYHFMPLHDDGTPCSGCASFTDNIPNLVHLRARDTTMALVSRSPLPDLEKVRHRLGWSMPLYSGPEFNIDCGAGGGFGISVFLRDGERVFRTYYTTSRGADRLRMDFNLLDLTPYGRQETWEDSPEGWPQTPPYEWWRLNDEYA
ncbi:DUF899 domain-containing protein [Nonomuraea africana]|uniref:Dithiol-disulfide oxidoreductase (DUF899 family) n=1 Tax=Nonomuraea africana TaxID=46171 RepID=A0ABR9KID0_9ACTN|nr:DUF899 domain-containing protein [Nonomuraea africana]MBE1561774.1 putative dithiol-disulfide oxidoreductase (DUF899 family) [Nonomuraea africana]